MIRRSALAARAAGRFALLCLVISFPDTASAQAVAGGHSHTVFATPTGDVYAWGWNASGQIGDGTTTNRHSPTLVAGLTNVVGVAAGVHHSVAVKSDGTVWTWGSNGSGQLGHGDNVSRTTPTQVSLLGGVKAVVAGGYATIALKYDGTVWAWGDNSYGLLGDGTTTRQQSPIQIASLSNVVGISAGDYHALAITSSGAVYSWGYNVYGQVGDGSNATRLSPVLLAGLADIVEVSAGDYHSLAKTSEGVMYAWGGNWLGQLGDGTWTAKHSPVMLQSPGTVTWLTAGGYTSHVTLADGGVKGWGANTSGEIGDGTTAYRISPVTVLTPPSVMLLESGRAHSIAATADGEVWAWGSNASGQVGDGTAASRLVPVRIAEAGYNWLVALPTFSASGGTYFNALNVVITSATAGATIHYTLNGAEPTTSDPTIASGASLQIDQALTLKARAWKDGQPPSATASAAYVFAAASPSFWPWPGGYPSAQTVQLSTQTSGATIHYTLDGSTPTTSSAVYSGPFSVGTTTTIRAIAVKGDWNPSAVVGGTYTMNFGTLATPVISPAPGAYDGHVEVTITAHPAATIRYTTNGGWVTTASPVYSGPLTVEATSTITARAFRLDYGDSAQASASYTITVQPPVLTPTAGTYPAGQIISVSSPTSGAVLRYTIDGTTPTSSSPIVPAAGIIAGNFTLKVIATKPGATSSGIVTAAYQVSGALTATRIAAAEMHSLAVRPDGVLWGWGYNGWGQLGDGTTIQRNLPVTNGLSGIVATGAGDSHSLAIRSDGSVVAWGSNSYGQLGDGTVTARNRPVSVQALTNAVAVDGAIMHSIALRSDGTVWSWGGNGNGQLGDGTTTQRLLPVAASTLANVTDIGAGYAYSIALRSDGTVWVWGTNGNGQLGQGDTAGRVIPTQVMGLGAAVAVDAGSYHSVALLADGTVRAWGYNSAGNLGDGTTVQRYAPVTVLGLSNIVAVAAGAMHTLALASDGSLWAWGQNQNGQVGDGTGVQRNSPVAVTGLPPIVAIAAGGQHSLAVAADGTVWAWGRNNFGTVGDGTTTNRLSPVQIADADMNWSVPAPLLSLASGVYSSTQTVTVTSPAADATLHYTTDGSTPTQANATIASGSSLPVTANLTLKVRAFKPGAASSGVTVGTYELKPATPTFSPSGGTYSSSQSVSLATATPNSVIRFTTDGSAPTLASPLYSQPIVVETTTTLKAVAFREGWSTSNAGTAIYSMNFGTLAAPVISPVQGLYEYGQLVTIVAETGSVIRYTTNGSTPTTASPVYSDAIVLQSPVTITAKAFRTDWTPSAATSAGYTVRANAPVLSPGAGTYAPGQTITLLSPTPGVTIRYTTDGSDPTAADTAIANGGTVPMGTFTLKGRAFHAALVASEVASAEYVKDGCSITASPSSISRSASAGGGVIEVAASVSPCVWTASSDAPWLRLETTSGNGTAFVPYVLDPNPSGAARAATVTIGGQAIAIVQQPEPVCSFEVTPLSVTAQAAGATGSAAVTASDASCAWAAASSAGWITLTAASVPGPYAAAVLADQPSGYWRLNETGGTVSNDSTPHARHGSVSGGLALGQPSPLGDFTTAAAFDGGSSAVVIADDAAFNTASASWEAWVKVETVSQQTRRILGRGADAFAIFIEGGDARPTISWRVEGSGVLQQRLQSDIVGAGWTHLAFTHDGTMWRAYVNGVEDSSGVATGAMQADTGAIVFGRSAAGGQWFDGELDDVAVYPYAMSGEQVANHFSASAGVGGGSASLPYRVEPNESGGMRSSALTIAGVFVPVSQEPGELSIAASVSPAANSQNWHATAVTVTFMCTGASSCPEPVILTADGVHDVTREASNANGSTVTASITVQIDRTPPELAVSVPGTDGSTQQATLTVQATVTDALSGVASATCNGASAVVTDGAIQCTVPLALGINPVIVQASDHSGNSVSIGRQITRTGTPTRIVVTPESRTMVIGEERELRAVDDAGTVLTDVTWATDEPSIVSLQAGPPAFIRAEAAGSASITATWQGLSASMQVAVVSGATLPPGTQRWTVAPTPGRILSSVFYAQVTEESAPEMYLVETESVTGPVTIRGLDSEGGQIMIVQAPTAPVFADVFGGLVSLDQTGMTRFAGPASAPPWRFQPAPEAFNLLPGLMAQAPDGTIYAVERTLEDVFVIGIDGQTGQLKFRHTLPRSINTTVGGGAGRVTFPPSVDQIAVAADGLAYLPVYHSDHLFVSYSSETQTIQETQWLTLFAFGPGGLERSEILDELSYDGPRNARPGSYFRAFINIPNGLDGVLAGWEKVHSSNFSTGTYVSEQKVARIRPSGNVTYSVPLGSRPVVADGSGTAYLEDLHNNRQLTAVASGTGAALWTLPADTEPVMALDEGGIMVRSTSTGQLRAFDMNGVESAAPPILQDVASRSGSTWTGIGSSGQLEAVEGLQVRESSSGFVQGRGNLQRQNAATRPEAVHIIPAPELGFEDYPLSTNNPYTPQEYERHVRQSVVGASVSFVSGPAATLSKFLYEARRKVGAIAFFGHSWVAMYQDIRQSMGIRLADRWLLKDLGAPWPPAGDGAPIDVINRIEPNANIIFIASCNIGPIFKQLWAIESSDPNDPRKRALIVPDPTTTGASPTVDFGPAAYAWREMLKILVRTTNNNTAQHAVDEVNLLLQGEGLSLRFKVEGHSDARIR